MNIFILHTDPIECAKAHSDKHVVKMILETAQMLSSAVRLNNIDFGYKITHRNHPCSLWCRKTRANFLWLQKLGEELCKEYTHRYFKIHKSEPIIKQSKIYAYLFADLPMTTFAQAMPEQYKNSDAVMAYRNYYIGEKLRFCKYTNRDFPGWLK